MGLFRADTDDYTNDHLGRGVLDDDDFDCTCASVQTQDGWIAPAEDGTCPWCVQCERHVSYRDAGLMRSDEDGSMWWMDSWDNEPPRRVGIFAWFRMNFRNLTTPGYYGLGNFFTRTVGLWGEQLWAMDSIAASFNYNEWEWDYVVE